MMSIMSQALRRTGHPALRDIGMSVREGVVYLEGSVASYYQKQLAQETVRQVIGELTIRNELDVASGRGARLPERREADTTGSMCMPGASNESR